MANEEPTEEAHRNREVNREIHLAKTGVVTNVREHASVDDRWNFHVDVRIGPNDHPRKVPVAVAAPQMIAPPRSEKHEDGPDLVLVQYIDDDETPRPVVTHILYNRQDRPPVGKEGEVKIRRGSLYAELADDGSYARIAKKSAGDASPAAQISINDQGGVTIETDQDITISASGNVTIDEGGTPKKVLTEDAVFEYEDTGDTSGGGATPTTKTTTTVSNGETTETEIE